MSNTIKLELRSSTQGRATIDMINPPEDLEEIIDQYFADYTEGTSEAFRDTDKLGYIDMIRRRFYEEDFETYRREKAHEILDWEMESGGDFDLERDVDSSWEFAEQAYKDGFMPLQIERRGVNHHDIEAVHHTLARIIATVINWRLSR